MALVVEGISTASSVWGIGLEERGSFENGGLVLVGTEKRTDPRGPWGSQKKSG